MTTQKQALVIFSGGQDSTTCLFQAINEFGVENVQTITFAYGQRHAIELERAQWIAQDLRVKQTVLDLSLIGSITHNALMDNKKETWALADQMGVLDYVREHTHTCYLGVPNGCHECPSCVLRERGLSEYLQDKNQ